jgi:hypothetical protein
MFVDVANGILSNCNEGHVIVVSHSIIEILIKEKKRPSNAEEIIPL